jgi:hypothetical protein
MSGDRQMPRWPLFLIASPAAVAVWSGWVGLGGLCGFGVVHPLPGIADGLRLNTAITLPVGVEAYGAYALGAWLTATTLSTTARGFAKWSAIGSLALGMCGQVIYHVLAAAHATRAPWPVVVLVACLPVVTLGFGAALTHLLRAPAVPAGRPASAPVPEPGYSADSLMEKWVRGASEGRCTVKVGHALGDLCWKELPCAEHPADAPAPVPAAEVWAVPAESNGHEPAARVFAAGLARGEVPSIRRIRAEMRCGQPRAREIQARLAALTPARQSIAAIRNEMRPGGTP